MVSIGAQTETYQLIGGSGGADLDRTREGRKPSMADFQKIQTERKALDRKTAGIIGQQ